MKYIDLRSDTVTLPTQEMRDAMYKAEVGDDSHIVVHEVGGASVIAGVNLRTLESANGELNPVQIETKIRKGDDIHLPNIIYLFI